MRLQPVAASPLARVAKRDLHFSDGTVIPAGVMVETAQYTPMRDERWGWHRGTDFLPVRTLACMHAWLQQGGLLLRQERMAGHSFIHVLQGRASLGLL